MKRKTTFWIEICKSIISCLLIPLYFIKFFHEVAVLPGIDENGETVVGRFNYYYSVYDKFLREGYLFLLWISIAIIVISITSSVLSLFIKQNKKLIVLNHVIFAVSIILFFIVLLLAASIKYDY